MIRTGFAAHRAPIRRPAWLMAGLLMAVACPIALGGDRGPRSKAAGKNNEAGRALFAKVWEPGKRSPAGGDGVGPLYNETSCMACHQLGGIGGGGRNEWNVALITAVATPSASEKSGTLFHGELPALHEGFRSASSIVLHRHSTDASDQKRLADIESFSGADTHDRIFGLRKSSRNSPAIFGDGLIDEISDEILLQAQRRKFDAFPEIQGRVSRLADGRLGRFGWKAQTATLREFVLAACANELGLEVPGNHQARLESRRPIDPAQDELDMDQDQCTRLVEFVASLPPPRRRTILGGRVEPWGYSVFANVGCAACHTPELGRVNGMYSDLLLHDMGESLGDAATYYGSLDTPGSLENLAEARERARATGGGVVATEWRTPPLWGVADSAPYLHDGRAMTLDSAIRLHGGEAAATAERYAKLSRGDRLALMNFLHSLTVAPGGRKAAAIVAIQARAHAETPERPRE